VVFGLLQGDGKGGQDVSDQVHREDLARGQWGGQAEKAHPDLEAELAEIASQQEAEGTAEVAPEAAPLNKGLHESREVVVGEYHVGRVAGNLRPAAAHRDTDIGKAERRPVVDAIPRHGDGVTKALQALNNSQLIQWRGPGDDRHVLQAPVELGVVEPSNFNSS
jgi:hypothetical protein